MIFAAPKFACFSKRREHTHVFNKKIESPIIPSSRPNQKNRFSSLEKRELPSENLKVNNCDFCRLESAATLLVRQPPKISKSANDLQKKGVPLWHRARICPFFEEFQFGFYSLLLVSGGLDDFEDLPDPSQCP